jgi:hypothetical protein
MMPERHQGGPTWLVLHLSDDSSFSSAYAADMKTSNWLTEFCFVCSARMMVNERGEMFLIHSGRGPREAGPDRQADSCPSMHGRVLVVPRSESEFLAHRTEAF